MMKLFFERIKSKLRRFIYNYELTHGKLEVKHEGIGSYKKEVRGRPSENLIREANN